MDHAPKSPSRRSRARLLILWSATALFLCGLAVCVGGYSLDWLRMRRSKDLVGRLRTLQVGQTTEKQVRTLTAYFDGKYFPAKESIQNTLSQPAHYDIGISSPYVAIGNSTHALPGPRLWAVFAYLDVENGMLAQVRLSQFVSRSDRFMLHTDVVLAGSERTALNDYGPYYAYEAHITGPAGEAFGVRLSPEATAEQRRKAFDLNFSCLIRLRECRHVCEILPNAWRDLSLDHQLRYEDGREVGRDSECRERMK